MITRILKIDQPEAIETAIEILNHGGVVAFPTDTVYGLGAGVQNEPAISRLYAVKGRAATKAIPVLIGKEADLDKIAGEVVHYARRFAISFWPGPLTLVVNRLPDLPRVLSSTSTVGVRMPDHSAALKLLIAAGPLAVTSANISGSSNAVSAEEVLAQLDGKIPLILDGGSCSGGKPSTVVDCTGAEPRILRQGPISIEDLQSVLDIQGWIPPT